MKTKDFYERDLFLNIQFQANTGVCQTYQEKKTFRNFVWSLLKLHFFFILGDVWKKANLPVKVNGEEFQLKFISTSKSGPQGDMAIDKVTLTQAPCGEQSLHNLMGNRGMGGTRTLDAKNGRKCQCIGLWMQTFRKCQAQDKITYESGCLNIKAFKTRNIQTCIVGP